LFCVKFLVFDYLIDVIIFFSEPVSKQLLLTENKFYSRKFCHYFYKKIRLSDDEMVGIWIIANSVYMALRYLVWFDRGA